MNIKGIINKVSSEHPYKVLGDRDSYSQYNEAWQDCIARIDQEVDVMKKENRFEFDFSGVESFECPCGRHYVNTADKERWIPVDKELPPNTRDGKSLCIRCLISTKYGVTEGWYNPFLESWYVLLWFMTKRYLNSEIDLERGACPNIVQVRNEANEKYNIVLAWRPIPKSYSLERSGNHDGE